MATSKPVGKPKELSPLMAGIAGGITGAIEISCTYPTEYIKTVMQLYPDKNRMGAVGVAKHTIREKGILGVYKGYSALLLFSVPKNYSRFYGYQFAQ